MLSSSLVRRDFVLLLGRFVSDTGRAPEFRAEHGAVLLRIGGQLWRTCVRIQQPHTAIAVVAQQFFVLLGSHVAGPYNLCVVDIGAVVNPVEQRIVIGSVAHEHKTGLRKRSELGLDGGAARADWSLSTRLGRGRENSHLYRDQNDAHHDHCPPQKKPDPPPPPAPQPPNTPPLPPPPHHQPNP